jgi:hypothetical protein
MPGTTAPGAPLTLRRDTLKLTSKILTDVITEFVSEKGLLPKPPSELHHFTSLETAYRIMAKDDVHLSHAEYSNDQTEMEQAKKVITCELSTHSKNEQFFAQILKAYEQLAPELDAYLLCMSTGRNLNGALAPQDILSQWRAYGQDGKGVCLTLETDHLDRLVYNTPSLRLNPVIYDPNTQLMFIDAILQRAISAHKSGVHHAHEAAIAALDFARPLMKAPGFAEEAEWRLIFVPLGATAQPQLGYRPRRDFLAPFISLHHVWTDLRPQMLEIRELRTTLPTILPCPKVPPLVLITKLMIGPSGHQSLNERSFTKLIRQTNRSIDILKSQIPYRSLG